jgi:hypothetical protein
MKKETDCKNRTYRAELIPTINGKIRAGIVFAQCKYYEYGNRCLPELLAGC